MKQRDIDRWMRRQARMNRHTSMPTINWAALVTIVAVVVALLIIVLKAAYLL